MTHEGFAHLVRQLADTLDAKRSRSERTAYGAWFTLVEEPSLELIYKSFYGLTIYRLYWTGEQIVFYEAHPSGRPRLTFGIEALERLAHLTPHWPVRRFVDTLDVSVLL